MGVSLNIITYARSSVLTQPYNGYLCFSKQKLKNPVTFLLHNTFIIFGSTVLKPRQVFQWVAIPVPHLQTSVSQRVNMMTTWSHLLKQKGLN